MIHSVLAISHPFFFFNDPAPTDISTLSLHDALPICQTVETEDRIGKLAEQAGIRIDLSRLAPQRLLDLRSEEHTSELQSQSNIVCRLLLEKKNTIEP